MQSGKFVIASAVGIALLGIASADPREYIAASGDAFVACDPSGQTPGIGGVCWPAGHFVGPEVSFSIVDDVNVPVSGFYCQDVNADSVCGDGSAGEPSVLFCGSLTVTEGVDYSPLGMVFIFIDSAVFGNPALSTCGTFSAGTHGWVHHS